MARTEQEVRAEIGRTAQMPHGLARVRAAEHLARQVEVEGPTAGYAAVLVSLINAYQFGDQRENGFVPFARLTRWWDEHPELFSAQDVRSLQWLYGVIVFDMRAYPQVPAEQIDAAVAQMRRHHRLAGLPGQLAAMEEFRTAWVLGRPEAESAYQEYLTTDDLDPTLCPLCEARIRAGYLSETGRTEQAVEHLERTLAQYAHRQTCSWEPHPALTSLTRLYLDQGRIDEAVRTHRRAMAGMDRHPADLTTCRGAHLSALARFGAATQTVRAIESDQDMLVTAVSPEVRLSFLREVVRAARTLRTLAPDHPVRLTEVPVGTLDELGRWGYREATGLAEQFDRRSGSDRYQRLLAQAWQVEAVAESVDLAVLPRDLLPGGAEAGRAGSGVGVGVDGAAGQTAGAAAVGGGLGTTGGPGTTGGVVPGGDVGPAGGVGAVTGPSGDLTSGDLTWGVPAGSRAAAGSGEVGGLRGWWRRLRAGRRAGGAEGGGAGATDRRADEPGTAQASADLPTAVSEALAEAERQLVTADPAVASAAFAQAAALADRAGALVQAGQAWAESARCAQVLGDLPGAHRGYAAAVARLRAGGGDPVLACAVLTAWAPAAVEADEPQTLLAEAGALSAALAAEDAAVPAHAKGAAARDDGAGTPDRTTVARRTAVRRAQADLTDTRARVLASRGGPGDADQAADLADTAARAYADLGRLAEAGHAFWLAGRVLAGLGRDDDALWSYESAMEGFALAHRPGPRGEVAGELMAALHRLGRHEQAEELAARLAT